MIYYACWVRTMAGTFVFQKWTEEAYRHEIVNPQVDPKGSLVVMLDRATPIAPEHSDLDLDTLRGLYPFDRTAHVQIHKGVPR